MVVTSSLQEKIKLQRDIIRRWHMEHPEIVAKQKHEYYLRNKDKCKRRAKRWQIQNPERDKIQRSATKKVCYAISVGKLRRPETCELCRVKGKITAAHHDYNRPLDVRWLCWPCHCRWDKQNPKLKYIGG